MKKSSLIILMIIILSLAAAIYLYPLVPDQMPTHWNSKGEVDGYMSKFWGLFLLPIIIIGVYLLFLLIPKIDPLKKNIEKFRNYYDLLIVVIILYLFYVYALTIAANFIIFNFSTALIPAFAALFYLIGMILSKAKRNWFVGIRTPWTLSSDKVWDKTHKLGSTLFKISAVIALLGIFVPEQSIWFLIGPVIASAIIAIVYSYFEYSKSK